MCLHLFFDGMGDFSRPDKPAAAGMRFVQWVLAMTRWREDRFRRHPQFVAILNNRVSREEALRAADNVLYVTRQSLKAGGAGGAAAAGQPADAPAAADAPVVADAPPKLTLECLQALAADPDSGLAGLLASQLACAPGTPQFWGRWRPSGRRSPWRTAGGKT